MHANTCVSCSVWTRELKVRTNLAQPQAHHDQHLIVTNCYQHLFKTFPEPCAGVWTRDLKVRTNLAQPQVTKMLKALEGKSLIKSVKNVNNPSRKLYMLFELEPSREITGGAWCVGCVSLHLSFCKYVAGAYAMGLSYRANAVHAVRVGALVQDHGRRLARG